MLRVRADDRLSCNALDALVATFALVTLLLLDFVMAVTSFLVRWCWRLGDFPKSRRTARTHLTAPAGIRLGHSATATSPG